MAAAATTVCLAVRTTTPLSGLDGDDILDGGFGDDLLRGGNGHRGKKMTGGLGHDTFDFNSVAEASPGIHHGIITDFSSVQGDRVDLSNIDADVTAGGNQAFTFIGTTAFGGNAGELRFNAGNSRILGDADGDGVADLVIEVTGVGAVAEGDFVL